MGGQDVGEPGSIDSLVGHVASLRTSDVIQTTAKINAVLERVGSRPYGEDQRDLVAELFPAPLSADLVARLNAGSDGGGFDVAFLPGQLMALQKVALAVGEPGPPTSFDDRALWSHFLRAAAQVNDVRDALAPVLPEDMTPDDLAIYGFRSGELGQIRYPPAVAGRAHRLWADGDLAWPSGLESPEEFCERTFGMPLRRFVAIALAPSLTRSDLGVDQLGDVPFHPTDYFAQTRVIESEARTVLDALTHPASLPLDSVTAASTYWSFLTLADRPLLRAGEDIIVPSSLRFGLERPSTGIFWMLHAANAGNVGPLTEHFGHMFESYCVRCAQGLSDRSTTVSGEITYGPRHSTRRTSDILITTLHPRGAARVFVECRAGRPPSALFESAAPSAFDQYIRDVGGKLGQLDRCIRDHLDGAFTIDGDLAGTSDPYFPILVLDEPFQWTFALKIVLDRVITSERLFRHPQVAAPVVCGVDDFDSLIGLCERGDDLADVLRSYLATGQLDPLDRLFAERTQLIQPSSYCFGGWDAATEALMTELF